jgi:hypothetical protein
LGCLSRVRRRPAAIASNTSDSFRDFDLADLDATAPQPRSDEIIVEQLRTGTRLTIARKMAVAREDRRSLPMNIAVD